MPDVNILITIVPPIFAAVIAYAIAKTKTNATIRIQQAKLEAEMNQRALAMVTEVVNDMKTEMRAEIEGLRTENKALKEEMLRNKEEIDSLRRRLHTSTELQDAMRAEINSLKTTIQWYEKRLKAVDPDSSTA